MSKTIQVMFLSMHGAGGGKLIPGMELNVSPGKGIKSLQAWYLRVISGMRLKVTPGMVLKIIPGMGLKVISDTALKVIPGTKCTNTNTNCLFTAIHHY